MIQKKEKKLDIINERQKFKINLRKQYLFKKIMENRYNKIINTSYIIYLNNIKINSFMNSLKFIEEVEITKNCKELLSINDIAKGEESLEKKLKILIGLLIIVIVIMYKQ